MIKIDDIFLKNIGYYLILSSNYIFRVKITQGTYLKNNCTNLKNFSKFHFDDLIKSINKFTIDYKVYCKT